MNRTTLARLLIMLCLVGTLGCGMPAIEAPDDRIIDEDANAVTDTSDLLTVAFIDVGQGDATLILAPEGSAMLIDAGPAGMGSASVLPVLRAYGVDRLAALIVTHYHADHIGGVAEIMHSGDVIVHDIFDRGGSYEGSSTAWTAYQEAAAGRRQTVHPGDRIGAGAVSVEVVAANGELADGTTVPLDPGDENAASLALVIAYRDFRLFVGGDLSGGGGNPPYETVDVETAVGELVGAVDVLQVNHHGSGSSTNAAFLDALTPEIAVISCGDDNDYFHPHQTTLNTLSDAGIAVYQTEECWTDADADVAIAHGTIILTTDGTTAPEIIY